MKNKSELEYFALQIRRGIVESIAAKGGGHIGGSLDLAEVLAVLYSEILNIRPEDPDWDDRDYVVCSKGHAGPAMYTTLALKGFFPYEWLSTLNRAGTLLPGHCDRTKVPGIDATTGSLGQGLSIACGLALGAKQKGKGQKVFCIVGDGELAEGQNWEAAQFAAHYALDNLLVFLDWNKKQIDGTNDEVMKLGDAQKKFEAFGWNAVTVNGQDVLAILEAVKDAVSRKDGKPFAIVLDTKKGAGVTCVESLANNHCIGFPEAMKVQALAELNAREEQMDLEVLK